MEYTSTTTHIVACLLGWLLGTLCYWLVLKPLVKKIIGAVRSRRR